MKKKQPTIKNIAQELNISFSTVSRALQNNSRISTKTREKVWEVAKRLEYTPNPAAYLLKSNKTFTIGILIPSLYEYFFAEVITGIENIIEAKGYHSVIIQSRESFQKEQNAVDAFLKMRIDGLIVSVSSETRALNHFQKLESYGIPVIFFDRVPSQIGYHKIKCNTKLGSIMAMNFLIEKGFKSIAFINGPINLETSEDRLQGYLEGLKNNNIPLDLNLIKNCDLSPEDTNNKFQEILKYKSKPEALLTFNNNVANYAMNYCRSKGLVPNKDITFVNFGYYPLMQFSENPPLASIDQFPIEMGMSASKLILDLIEESLESPVHKEVVIQPKLVINQ